MHSKALGVAGVAFIFACSLGSVVWFILLFQPPFDIPLESWPLVPLSAIFLTILTYIFMARRRREMSNAAKGTFPGAIIGFFLGIGLVIVFFIIGCSVGVCTENWQIVPIMFAPVAGILGLILGAGVGAVFGAVASKEQAKTMPADRRDDLNPNERDIIQASVDQKKPEQRQKRVTKLIGWGAFALLLLGMLLVARLIPSTNCIKIRRAIGIDVQCQNFSLFGFDLIHADLSKANLCEVDLSGANLRGADLREANLDRAILNYAKYSKNTQWPSDFDQIAAGALPVLMEADSP